MAERWFTVVHLEAESAMPSRRDVLSLIGRNTAGLAAVSALGPGLARAQAAEPEIYKGHGMAMHGPPKYGADFKHFEFVNPAAPKGGSIYHGAPSATFDSFNPFILKGSPVGTVASLVFDSLMKSSADEPFTMYGLIAKSIETPKDRSWVAFELDERARFHDGSPITPDDVIFSFQILTSEKAHPSYRQYYHDVVKAEAQGPRGVKFTFRVAGNRELPLITGQLPVLPKAYWASRQFDQVTLDRPLGSGAYKLGDFAAGRYVVFERVKDYWAADLPVNRGYSNFDAIRIEYYRDATVAREAFKAGDFDFRAENQALAWATQYETEPVRKGELKKLEVPHQRPAGMQCFVMNTRRAQFKDWRVRRALALLFDFEWTNKNLFYGAYKRTTSFFANSEMAATGLPQGKELELLERFKGRIPESVFKETYTLPVYSGDGNIREGIRAALVLLKEAGYDFKGTDLVDKNGQQLRFEILIGSPTFERVYLPYIANLKRIGIAATPRLVDPTQYQKREDDFDFDMTTGVFGQSESPGNEQRDFWSSKAADTRGSRNTIGIKDPVIDELVDLIINATDRDDLVMHCRALDRVLLHHHFVVPSWHLAADRMIYWDKFGVSPPHRRGTSWLNWWYDAGKAERLKGRIRSQT
jgi:microcin C transport system substrate-binding protein